MLTLCCLASAADRVKEAAGRVDILVLCAAIAGKPYKLSPQVSTTQRQLPTEATVQLD
jgi:NAD(P)-dependent dehydrogenase (short-subunit alcohol dehydrogenase family)